jgi:hypothetical protein
MRLQRWGSVGGTVERVWRALWVVCQLVWAMCWGLTPHLLLQSGLELIADFDMPSNNRLLAFVLREAGGGVRSRWRKARNKIAILFNLVYHVTRCSGAIVPANGLRPVPSCNHDTSQIRTCSTKHTLLLHGIHTYAHPYTY